MILRALELIPSGVISKKAYVITAYYARDTAMDKDPCFHLKNSKINRRLSRMVLELAEGHEKLEHLGLAVGVFGSSQLKASSPYYDLALELGKKLAQAGFAVVTGGGPGIMEAANQGAQKANGKSCGISIDLDQKEPIGSHIDPEWHLHFRYFFTRKILFVSSVKAFVFLPGGYGSMDELFEMLTLIQTKRIERVPLYLIGSKFWAGLIDWIKCEQLESGMIGECDFDLLKIEDDLGAVIEGIKENA